ELRLGKAARGRRSPLENGVLRALVEVGEVDADALEERRLESRLELLPTLGLEPRIAGELRRDDRLVAGSGCRLIGLQRSKGVGLLTGKAVGDAQTELVEDGKAPESFVAHDPRRAQLRVRDEVDVLAEGA